MSYPGSGRADYFLPGDWNAVCYECGRKRKGSTLKRNWQGYYVCPEHWEARQPQDFVRSVPDVITPPWAQPVSDSFRYVCDFWGASPMADYAQAGCAVVGGNTNLDVAWMAQYFPAIAGEAVASRSISGRARV
jgi:hypothetical protein